MIPLWEGDDKTVFPDDISTFPWGSILVNNYRQFSIRRHHRHHRIKKKTGKLKKATCIPTNVFERASSSSHYHDIMIMIVIMIMIMILIMDMTDRMIMMIMIMHDHGHDRRSAFSVNIKNLRLMLLTSETFPAKGIS